MVHSKNVENNRKSRK